jgi:HSP20 family protein
MYPSLTTYPGDPFAEFEALQRELGRMFGGNDWPSSIRAAARGAFPAINMGTTEEAVEIFAFAPGLDPANLDVHVEKGLLVIAGERKGEVPASSQKLTVYAQERFEGAFKRVVGLPEEIDSSRIEATYRDGVLRILVPKREALKPRRIEVQSAEKLEQKP